MNEPISGQNICIFDRRRAEITAVCDVDSFSEFELSAHIEGCRVVIDGENLKIEGFNSSDGKLTVIGHINGVVYFDDGDLKKSVFSRKKR